MSTESAKPVIFISYSHKDEPEHPREGEIQWLSFVRTYLQPAVKHGVFDLWVDQRMPGGADWGPEIERRLRACDIFILLVSANSMASDYIIDKEIAIIRARQANGEPVHFYPLLLTPTPKAGLDKVKDKNLRPRDAKPFSSHSFHDRAQHMTDAADEIAELVEQIAKWKSTERPSVPRVQPAYVHITGLPETAYERLIGRETELKRLDEAWAGAKTNVISLVAEGGAGKSALVNEWVRRLQTDNYRGAEAVLGWSFYSQGTKERTTSAEGFLDWALDKLGITLVTTSVTAKADAIAEAMMKRRVLLLLDGLEPLQHGLDRQIGELKDLGLRALLRRFVTTPAGEGHGLIVLTSRLAVKDIARWQDGGAPVVDLERLSDDAGAALLRDNGVWGNDKELKAATHDFGGHPLALGLLASFLKETQAGDVRRRDRIRAYLADPDNPRHDHARRVMESYEKEWLAGQPVLLAIMHMVGLFDRPASADCLDALRVRPAIKGLTDQIVGLDEGEWRRAIARLREVRLLAPSDSAVPDALDAHPLVREWFGERLQQTNEAAWKTAHGRLYEHLRDTTKEGKTPTLEDLTPLYQAIAHGCRAGRHQEALDKIYVNRLCRRRPDGRPEFYSSEMLGATSSELVGLSCFFDNIYQIPAASMSASAQSWVLDRVAYCLLAQGRIAEAAQAVRSGLHFDEKAHDWKNAAVAAGNLALTELTIGQIDSANASANSALSHARRTKDVSVLLYTQFIVAEMLLAAGNPNKSEAILEEAERLQGKWQPIRPILYSKGGYIYCDLLLSRGDWESARKRAQQVFDWEHKSTTPSDKGFVRISLARAHFGLALEKVSTQKVSSRACELTNIARLRFEQTIESMRTAGALNYVTQSLIARSSFLRSIGHSDRAARDLDEVEEIAEPGPMRLYLCDIALERARLAFARSEAFAPLNGLMDDSPPKPERPGAAERKQLQQEAENQLAIAADYIGKCGYRRRDAELAELQAVLKGEKTFAELPPRV